MLKTIAQARIKFYSKRFGRVMEKNIFDLTYLINQTI